MANYILLRDNKQTAPLSLDQIVQKGFKPYDLVWVEGKSAAWRYPYEIAELKPHAPVVEEQPFDRFYKKNTSTEKPEEQNKPQQQNLQAPEKVIALEKKEAITSPHESYMPKRSVFVTMPENVDERKEIKKEISTSPSSTPVITIHETPPVTEIKYSQPLDEIKEMYVKTLVDRKQKNAKREFLFRNMKRAAVFVIMIAIGVIAGFALKSNKKNNTVALNKGTSETEQTVTSHQETILNELQPEELTIDNSQVPEEPKQQLQDYNTKITEKKQERQPVEILPAKENVLSKQQKSVIDPNQNSPGADIDPVTGERNKKARTGIDEKVEKPVETKKTDNFSNLASVKSNNYERGAFGGIRNLELTVTNQSKYLLDKVVVELQYLKPSEEPLRSENILFRSIPADGTMTIAIPPTNRGIKVSYKITKVESKELNDETAGL